jgi:hypothetical protein
VIESYEALGKKRRRYRKESPKALLDLDLESMSAEERAEAAGSLREALRLLEEAAPEPKARPGMK